VDGGQGFVSGAETMEGERATAEEVVARPRQEQGRGGWSSTLGTARESGVAAWRHVQQREGGRVPWEARLQGVARHGERAQGKVESAAPRKLLRAGQRGSRQGRAGARGAPGRNPSLQGTDGHGSRRGAMDDGEEDVAGEWELLSLLGGRRMGCCIHG
jgi:hypothetical protein